MQIDEKRVSELMKELKKVHPEMDNYLLYLCCADFVFREEQGNTIDPEIVQNIKSKFESSRNGEKSNEQIISEMFKTKI